MTHRNAGLLRLFRLLTLIGSTPHGVTLVELMRLLGVTERTVRRDLRLLQAAQLPIQRRLGAEPDAPARWRLTPRASCPVCHALFPEVST